VDANAQLMQCVMSVAGNREHGTTRVAPLLRFAQTEKALLKCLPVKPPELATWAKATVHGDCHIQVKKRRYSAPYTLVSKELDVRLSETTVRLYHQHTLFATHPRLAHIRGSAVRLMNTCHLNTSHSKCVIHSGASSRHRMLVITVMR